VSRGLRNIFGSSGWYKQPIPKINFRYQLSLTADTKNKRSFFVSAIVISRYKKLRAGVTINRFSSSVFFFKHASCRSHLMSKGLHLVHVLCNRHVHALLSCWKLMASIDDTCSCLRGEHALNFFPCTSCSSLGCILRKHLLR
jgi:hypothetical protein